MPAWLKSALESTVLANVLLIVSLLVPAGIWLAQRRAKPRLFTLHLQKGKTPTTAYRLTPGESHLELLIHMRRPVEIDRFNLRFFDASGLPSDESVIRVTGFTHAETVFRAPGNARAQLDGKGGIEVLYDPPMRRSPSDDIRITLSLWVSSKLWDGYLSLRGFDNDGHARFARLKCVIQP